MSTRPLASEPSKNHRRLAFNIPGQARSLLLCVAMVALFVPVVLTFLDFDARYVKASTTKTSSAVMGASARPQSESQIVHIPYFTEQGDMTSTLTLNNNLPEATQATVTVFNSKGEAFTAPPISLPPMNAERFSLRAMTQAARGDFRSGNVQVSYYGPSMGVTSQISIASASKHLAFESVESSMMDFASARLDGIVWIPDADTEASTAVSNTTTATLSVSLTTATHEESLTLNAHETRVVDLREFLDGRPSAAKTLLRIAHNGMPGAVIATGFAISESTGFSCNLTFVDRATAKTAQLAGAHIRFGRADSKEGFPTGTRFLAPLLVANASDQPTTARVTVDYTMGGVANRAEIATLNLASQQVQQVELASAIAQGGVQGPVEDAGVDITYSGSPGAVIARLTSVDQGGDYAFDVPIKDPLAEMMRVSGSYPWRLDAGYTTVLHLKNTRGQRVYGLVQVRYAGGTYNLERLPLAPYQGIAVDIRGLRDGQQKDIRGNVMPKDVESGQVIWYEETVGSLIGRAEVRNTTAAIASSFSCGNTCTCPPSFQTCYLSPSSMSGVVGDAGQCYAMEMRADCYTQYGPYDRTTDSTWTTSNASVATVYNGYVSCVGVGSCSVNAQFSSTVYTDYPYTCAPMNVSGNPGGSVSVCPSASISGPNAVPLGTDVNTIQLSSTVNPPGGAYLWSTTSSLVTLSNTNAATVTVQSVSQSMSQNDVTIQLSYQVNGCITHTFTTLTVQKPNALGLVTTTSQGTAGNCGAGSTGWERNVKWQVVDQFGTAMRFANMSATDTISLGTPNTCGASNPLTGTGFTDSTGQFPDRYSFCSPGCISGDCQLQATQSWRVNGINLSTSVSVFYTCRSITLNGQ